MSEIEKIVARLEHHLGMPGDCVTVRDSEMIALIADWRKRGWALRIIAGELPPVDYLMGHSDVARVALKSKP